VLNGAYWWRSAIAFYAVSLRFLMRHGSKSHHTIRLVFSEICELTPFLSIGQAPQRVSLHSKVMGGRVRGFNSYDKSFQNHFQNSKL
jgi:hypothetical protein